MATIFKHRSKTGPEVNIAPRKGAIDTWNVEAIDEDGSIEQAIFTGPNAEKRARLYAEYQYAA